jgi:hypothetical protein
MPVNNEKKWLSYRVRFGEKPDLSKQDKFLIEVFSPLIADFREVYGVEKFIYTRYVNDTRVFGGLPGFETPPHNYITVRFLVPEPHYDKVSTAIETKLREYESTLVVAFALCNDWGKINNNKCYDDYGGIEMSNLINDYLYQISRISLELLKDEHLLEARTANREGEEAKLYHIAPQWAHILYNQMGISSVSYFADEKINEIRFADRPDLVEAYYIFRK